MSTEEIRGFIIDDDPNVLELCQQRFPFYLFKAVADHKSAESLIQSDELCHFIILDYKLGKSNGFNLISHIRKHRLNIPILILTAYSSKSVMIEAIDKKPDAFIEKPINFQELQDRIDTLTNKAFPENQKNYTISIIITNILDDLNNNDPHILELRDYAAQYKMSYKYLSRVFKEKSQYSFRDLVVAKKIRIAEAMLKKTDLSVVDIASRIGYWNPSSFMKIFKKIKGLTPDQFRKAK